MYLAAGTCWGKASDAPSTVDACKALQSIDLSAVADAPTQIVESDFVNARGAIPAYCEVRAYVSPSVGVEVRLPLLRREPGQRSDWNGKFLQVGCGGLCGTLLSGFFATACDYPLQKGYACLASDMGHASGPGDGKWGYNNLQAKVDFAYRATHVASLAGKAIVQRFYGRAIEKSYFIGASQGGRQALVEAQNFPWDFDGIIAGAPAINLTGAMMGLIWTAENLRGPEGQPALTPANLQLLYEATLARCDAVDGLRDGVISDPRSCNFDPSELLCTVQRRAAA